MYVNENEKYFLYLQNESVAILFVGMGEISGQVFFVVYF